LGAHTLWCLFLFLTMHGIAPPPLFPPPPQGPSDKVASISLQNLRFSSSSTPIRVSSAVQVQLTVRVDASCSATASHPASRRALVATISIRLQDGSTRVFRTKRSSWQWAHNGSLVDSPEWEGAPLDDPHASAGATWLTNPPRPSNRTSWATIMTTLPEGACQDADPNAGGVMESNGGTEQRRGWGTAPLATTAVLGGLLLLMSGVAAAMQTALHRLRRLDGGADDGTDGPDKSGKREPHKTSTESLEKNADTPPGALRVSTAVRHRQRLQAASHDMSSASTSHWPRADADGPPHLMTPRDQRTPPKARYPTVLSQPPPTSFTGPSIASCHAGTCPSLSSIEAQHCQVEQGDGDNDLKRLSDLAAELATGFRAPPSVPTALLSSMPPPLPAALLSPGPPPLPAVLFSPAPPPLPAVLLSPDPLSVPAERRHPPSV